MADPQSGDGQVLYPAFGNLQPELLQRVRWRCRRGLLELDIVLGRFVEVYYAKLDASERQIFEQLLDMADNPLWDLIAGRSCDENAQAALLEKIKSV
ncbi:MAG: succinate dehydrogenase assembly factor 2 [Gallionella sp.]